MFAFCTNKICGILLPILINVMTKNTIMCPVLLFSFFPVLQYIFTELFIEVYKNLYLFFIDKLKPVQHNKHHYNV